MYTKFIANGEDLTDVFYWEPSDDVVRGNYGIPTTMSLYPFADKAKRVDEKFRQWGIFVIEYYGSAGRAGYRVQFLRSVLDCKHKNGKEVAFVELKVLARA
ncbi:MAG: hypothetical protein F4X66_14480 [Chloroflexi bacterium]|nr:hypothetical protein [Chloroflexota bacterium]MYE39767.1 hypothetical protein [Chloroflexota bacterium]